MLTGLARRFNLLSVHKAACQAGAAALMLLACAGSVHDATALNETRTLSFHHTHSGEDLTVTFKRQGRYDEEALKTLNHFLRDWRTQDQTAMDRHLFDIIWEVYRDVDAKQPIQIVSAYRSPATNAMLRRRSAHSGVARASQHMLGHAMDFYIPGVQLEQIRFAGLRLQRGGVGFYPTSGSPFVHLDTGNIRHWPRMTHDQLVRVFPDGRTVHIPTDGVPLKGYELAKADIERRSGDDATTVSNKPSFLAALFKGKSSDDDDDAGSASEVNDRPAPIVVAAAASKPAEALPWPRARPQLAATLQLASADSTIAQSVKPKQQTAAANDKAEAKPETPADIINARGFWDDDKAAPKQATAAEAAAAAAAIRARRALDGTDPQATASTPAALDAMAYDPPPSSPVDRANLVTATAPIPRSAWPAMQARSNSVPATGIDTVAAKGVRGDGGPVTNSARIAAASTDSAWLRIIMLAPSVGASMEVTVLGDTDLTMMRAFFVKPASVLNIGFSDDPMMGMSCDHFSGSSSVTLETTSLVVRTAQR
ncbi:DUF882 domain-containing protein [Bradyrhizobium sp. Tv2a-2]|uniref:DUF882 domain-containing protein n=1 Tax=Bradyrhizobium sp. Tv2a-2 TaxID=113395 RepID=UPI001FD8F434|nr:DUF882 domain-containing protein [Bradyrhizobium sp. Tv2a-2]